MAVYEGDKSQAFDDSANFAVFANRTGEDARLTMFTESPNGSGGKRSIRTNPQSESAIRNSLLAHRGRLRSIVLRVLVMVIFLVRLGDIVADNANDIRLPIPKQFDRFFAQAG